MGEDEDFTEPPEKKIVKIKRELTNSFKFLRKHNLNPKYAVYGALTVGAFLSVYDYSCLNSELSTHVAIIKNSVDSRELGIESTHKMNQTIYNHKVICRNIINESNSFELVKILHHASVDKLGYDSNFIPREIGLKGYLPIFSNKKG